MKKIQYILSLVIMAAAMVSCSQDLDVNGSQGYVALRIQSFVSTNTPEGGTRAVSAPGDYNAKQLCVEIKDQSGAVIKSTDDFENDAAFQDKIALDAGTYTIEAHSANWDGSGSGFDAPYYYGSTTVNVQPQTLQTASITCTQANVKLTVTFDQTFVDNFKSATATITSSLQDVAPLAFVMNQTTRSGYIPAGDFEAKLDVVNKSDVEHSLTRAFTDVQPRDHYILNFKLADDGVLGGGDKPGITVDVDESTNTYTYTFEVPTKSAIALVARQANAWSNFAMLNASITAKTESFDQSALTIQWRQSGTETWNEMANSELTVDGEDNVTASLKGLTPGTAYEYRLHYGGADLEVASEPVAFTTEASTALQNSGFESWFLDGKAWSPNSEGEAYWATSNPGSTLLGEKWNVTTGITDGAFNGTSAQLKSTYVVIKFAAASLFTGTFEKLIGTNGAELNWGVPFTSRPTSLKGYMKYTTGAINRGNQPSDIGAAAKGENDACQVFCALLTESLKVANASNSDGYEMSTAINWQTDPRVIAFGELTQNTSDDAWKAFEIPLVYRSLTQKPTHLLIVCTSSRWGDYFYGCDSSTLLLDDFSLEYGNTPTVRQ